MNNNQRDVLDKLGDSLVQHGELNDRIYLIKLAPGDYPRIVSQLEDLADGYGYSKIFAKVPAVYKEEFFEQGYRQEASVPSFYNGKGDASFLGKYLKPSRMVEKDKEKISAVLKLAKKKASTGDDGQAAASGLETGFNCAAAVPSDAQEMAQLYRRVFKTYPFPIDDPEYLKETMKNNVVYFTIRHQEKIVALSSCEIDPRAENVEMTDFATLKEYAGSGLATYLLSEMEKEMQGRGLKTAYTIARAISKGINITFAKTGYLYGGTLWNNTNIGGSIESMNVWYKHIGAGV